MKGLVKAWPLQLYSGYALMFREVTDCERYMTASGFGRPCFEAHLHLRRLCSKAKVDFRAHGVFGEPSSMATFGTSPSITRAAFADCFGVELRSTMNISRYHDYCWGKIFHERAVPHDTGSLRSGASFHSVQLASRGKKKTSGTNLSYRIRSCSLMILLAYSCW